MEIAGNPAALFGDRELALTFRFALGIEGTFFELDDLLAPQARSLASKPSYGPDDSGVRRDDSRKSHLPRSLRAQVNSEQPDYRACRAPRPWSLPLAARRQQVECGGEAEGQLNQIADARQQRTRCRSHHEHAEREAPPDDERHRRARCEYDADQIEFHRSESGSADGAV